MKYSLDEIDFMRWCVAADYVLEHYPSCLGMHIEDLGLTECGKFTSYRVNKNACQACLSERITQRMDKKENEERLRTLMIAGIAPSNIANRVRDREMKSPALGLMFWPSEFERWWPPLDPL